MAAAKPAGAATESTLLDMRSATRVASLTEVPKPSPSTRSGNGVRGGGGRYLGAGDSVGKLGGARGGVGGWSAGWGFAAYRRDSSPPHPAIATTNTSRLVSLMQPSLRARAPRSEGDPQGSSPLLRVPGHMRWILALVGAVLVACSTSPAPPDEGSAPADHSTGARSALGALVPGKVGLRRPRPLPRRPRLSRATPPVSRSVPRCSPGRLGPTRRAPSRRAGDSLTVTVAALRSPDHRSKSRLPREIVHRSGDPGGTVRGGSAWPRPAASSTPQRLWNLAAGRWASCSGPRASRDLGESSGGEAIGGILRGEAPATRTGRCDWAGLRVPGEAVGGGRAAPLPREHRRRRQRQGSANPDR